MIKISPEMKTVIVAALIKQRDLFDGSDAKFAKKYGINGSVYSTIKNTTQGNYDGLLREAQWLNLARELDIPLNERKWNVAKTDVFLMIEQDIVNCKVHAKSFMLCDDCGIGKTFTAKYLSRTLPNCFYVDARQSPSKTEFIRALAKVLGVEDQDKLVNIRSNIKYALKMIPNPVVIVDEAGALEDRAAMLLIELWNATERACGWYLMGADGLRAKVERNMKNKKVGWAELFSRFNEKYNTVVPKEKVERQEFYEKLISDVLKVNMTNKKNLNKIVRKCLVNDSGRISGLRRAETLVVLEEQEA